VYVGLHVKHLSFLSDIKIFEFSQQGFEIYSDIKFNENPSMWTDGQTWRSKKSLFAISRTRLEMTPDFEPNAFAFRMQF